MVEERVQRRLAAIVAADMVGYSRLMEIDEADTLARQKAIQAELINPKVKEFGGRVVKTTGDGALIEFPSAVNAVLCSVAVQREMAGREADIPEDRRIAYRIGINLGEIIHDGDDIFGDGVNVASRLEGLAEPGGIRISEAVFNNVKGKLDLGFADLGPQKVKNLAEPIPTFQVLLDPGDAGKIVKPRRQRPPVARNVAIAVTAIVLILAGGYIAWDRFMPADTGEEKLLVLPLRAENYESGQVADAATENLIASFARLNGLITAPHAVSMEYKGIDLEPDELSSELGIRYVLDGSAKLQDDRVELSARLRARASRDVVWEQTVEGESAQLFDLLVTLKQNAVGTMKVTLNPTERAILESRPTENIEAYLAFAEAEHFRYSGNFFELEKALLLYQQAMELDPEFIEAQVGYAEANFTIWSKSWNTIRFTPDALVVAEETIARILEADGTNPYAIGLQARIEIEWLNHEQALSEARGAVFLQPDEPWLRNVLGLALLASGKYEEAKEEFASYEALSPRLNSGEKRDLAFQYLLLGDAKKALSLLASVPTEEADRIAQYRSLANTHARLGDIEIARINLRKVLKNVSWLSLSFYKARFAIYSDPTIFEEWSAAMTAAGFPESPYDFEAGREGDRLLHDDLVNLFSDRYQEVHAVGPFGMPYKEDRRADGTLIMDFAWMDGKLFTGKWYIKGDQFCHRIPAQHVDREECNNVYIDREKSTDSIKYISNVYSWGIFNSEFTRVEE